MKAARARGTRLGAENPACRNWAILQLAVALPVKPRHLAKAVAAFVDVLPTITKLRNQGLSLRAIAERFSVEYPRDGGSWQATHVKRMLDRAA